MRTTIDLPDDLFRQAKARAALEGRKLKELIADYVQRGLEGAPSEAAPPERRRSLPPVAHRSAATGQTIPALRNAEIASILDEEDAQHLVRLAGR